MIQIILTFSTLYQLSVARRLLQFVPPNSPLQPLPQIPNTPQIIPQPLPVIPDPVAPTNPAPTSVPTPAPVSTAIASPNDIGAYGQQCVEPQSHFSCRSKGVAIQGTKVECGVDYSCCMCQSISCGTNTKPCEGVSVGGDYGLYAVQDINIIGTETQPTSLICGASFSCAETRIIAENIYMVGCSADNACTDSVMELTKSNGLSCVAHHACVRATFIMTDNIGGDIRCITREACHNTEIITQNINTVRCDGQKSCKNANIRILSPTSGFSLICNDDFACENLKLELTIPTPANGCPVLSPGEIPEYVHWFGVTCGSQSACKGLEFTVINDGCKPILIETLECEAPDACTGSIFNFGAGKGPFSQMVDITHCKCGASCKQATGIDKCYDNMHVVSCAEAQSCMNQRGYIQNPANGFQLLCPRSYSCAGLGLGIIVSGGSQNLVRTMKGIDCRGPNGCQGAVIMFTNTQTDHMGNAIHILIDTITCSRIDSCKDSTFITGPNVSIQAFICDTLFGDACSGCRIKVYPSDEGEPCQPVQATPIIAIQQPDPTQGAQTPVTTTTTSQLAFPSTRATPTEAIPTEPAFPWEIATSSQSASPATPAQSVQGTPLQTVPTEVLV